MAKGGSASKAKRTLRLGLEGSDVAALQRALKKHGFNPGAADGIFGAGTQAAVMAFQRSAGLLADGVAGPRTLGSLSTGKPQALPYVFAGKSEAEVFQVVAQMFPHTPLDNIKANLPPVLAALVAAGLVDRMIVLMSLATIRAETESFEPIAEGRSRYNSSPGGRPFDLYDNRRDLGNQGPPDGERFRGRGYVQLTGRANYETYGAKIGLGKKLLTEPELASEPDVAAQLLAAFIAGREIRIKEALLDLDMARARRLVNGGSHGIERFTAAYETGIALTA